MSKFAYNSAAPHHLSVGALVYNEEGKVLAHHFDAVTIPDNNKPLHNVYMLMRETLEDDQSLEEALHNGLMIEMGVTGNIVRYLGPVAARIPRNAGDIEKLTLYFSVLCTSFDLCQRSKTEKEYEYNSTVDWFEPSFLMEKMKDQGTRYDREDVNEVVVIERFLKNV